MCEFDGGVDMNLQEFKFQEFAEVDFPPPKGALPGPPGGYVYVFFWANKNVEIPFYVGETARLSGRMNDYAIASFSACTDFQVGEAARYLRDVKNCRIVVKYKPSAEREKEEKYLTRELTLAGIRLLKCLPSYNYRDSDSGEERAVVQRFCNMLISRGNLD
jgi:hypothetical protein